MIKKYTPILIIVAQIAAIAWYLWPTEYHAHVPGGFIEMLIFGGITLVLLIITIILYAIYKPKTLIWKIPLLITLVMLMFAIFKT